MTSGMCGIRTTKVPIKVPTKPGGWGGMLRLRRVPPFQGGNGLFGPSSQGVALGYRVVAPLAQNTGATQPLGRLNRYVALISQPEGLPPVSPGQRPGNSAPHKMICPEWAKPGPGHVQARDLESTIAGNVTEIGRVAHGESSGAVTVRVLPFQGEDGLFGPSSQGVALGYRVVAPLARKATSAMVNARRWANHVRDVHGMRSVLQPEGLPPVSPGQRPGNSAPHKMIRPERATRGEARLK